MLNEAPMNNTGDLHNGHFDKHSPLLTLEYFRTFRCAQKSSWTAEGTDQQEAPEQERADLGASCMKSLLLCFSLLETFVGVMWGTFAISTLVSSWILGQSNETQSCSVPYIMGKNKQRRKATDQVAASIYKLLVSIFYMHVCVSRITHACRKKLQPVHGWSAPVGTTATGHKIPGLIGTVLSNNWVDPFLILFPTISTLGKHFLVFCAAGWPLANALWIQQPAAWWAHSRCSHLTTLAHAGYDVWHGTTPPILMGCDVTLRIHHACHLLCDAMVVFYINNPSWPLETWPAASLPQ